MKRYGEAVEAQNKSLESIDGKLAMLGDDGNPHADLSMMVTNKNTQSFSQLMENSQDHLYAPNNLTISSSYHTMPQLQGQMLAHNASLGSIQIHDQEKRASSPAGSRRGASAGGRRVRNEKRPVPLTEEQKKQLERQRKQAEYKEELENQLRQKKHPLDFRPGELDEIKSQFPEFQRVVNPAAPQRFSTSAKVPGMKITDLKQLLKKKMILDQEQPAVDEARIDDLIDKLDRKNEKQINWQEFLKFLDHEGLRREMVNEALLYGMGVKRLKKHQRKSLKETPKQTESYINNCVYIKHGNTELLLFLFENNQAKIFDAKALKVVQEIEYTSDYGKPKTVPPSQLGPRVLALDQGKHRQSAAAASVVQATNLPQKSISSQVHLQSQKSAQNFNPLGASGPAGSRNVTQSPAGWNSQMPSGSSQSRRALSQAQSTKQVALKQELKAKAVPDKAAPALQGQQYSKMLHRIQASGSSALLGQRTGTQLQKIMERKTASQMSTSKLNAAKPEWQQHYERQRKRKNTGQAYGVLGIDPVGSDDEGQQAKMIGKDLKKDESAYGVKFLLPDLYADCNKHKVEFEKLTSDTVQTGNRNFRSMIKENKKALAKVRKLKEQKLGSEKEELRTQKSATGVPATRQRHLDSESSDEAVSDRDKQNEVNDSKSKPADAVHLCGKPDPEKRCRHKKILAGLCTHPPEVQYDAWKKLKKSESRLQQKDVWLRGLKETNKYFYRPNDPSPTKIATYQYHKSCLEKKGVDTTNEMEVKKQLMKMNITPDEVIVSHITGRLPPSKASSKNYCTPEMISKRVEKLRKEEKARQDAEDKFKQKKKESTSHEQNAHARKLKQRQTKSVYCMCAAYNEELGLLALSLIDKEIQIYRIKQNGSKVHFVPHSSFDAKYYTTCMFMERCVANSRPILCMGSNTGEIQIYYLNEHTTDQKKQQEGKVRAKQHKNSPFNFFKCPTRHTHEPNPVETAGLASSNQFRGDKYAQTFNASTNKSARSSHKNLEGGSQAHAQPMQQNADGKLHEAALHQRRLPEDTILEEEDNNLNEEGPVTESEQRESQNDQVRQEVQNPRNQDWALNFLDFDALEKMDVQEKKTKKPLTQKNVPLKYRNDIEITSIKYVRDIGLIATSFNGTLKFFDAFEFQEQWCSSNASRKKDEHTNITVFDISVKLGLMATGGAEGKLILIDPYAQGIMNKVDAHSCEILQLYIFDEQQQIITVAQDRSIGLWDARLEKIEVIKDIGEGIHAPKFTSSSFDYRTGRLYVGCQQITVWEAQTDQKVEINALQVKTLSKPILKDRKMQDTDDPSFVPDKDATRKDRDPDARTGRVLVTQASQLVEIVVNEADGQQFLITIDSENLLRAWNTEKSLTVLSYRILVLGRITAAAVDDTNKYLAVGTSQGEAKVINLKSGGNLYDLVSCQQEISYLQFINGRTEFWLFGACWGGRLMMWTQPSEDNNFTIAAKCKIGHESDIIAMDCTPFFVATGDDSGVVAVWNAFSGQLKYLIEIPVSNQREPQPNANSSSARQKNNHRQNDLTSGDESSSRSGQSSSKQNSPMAADEKDDGAKPISGSMRRSIVGLCFHPYYQNHICVLQEAGNIHMIDGTAGVISDRNVAMAITNSSWACDPYRLRMLVVGDIGRGCLFDISMQCREEETKHASSTPGATMDDEEPSEYDSDCAPYTYLEKKQLDAVVCGKGKKADKKRKMPDDFRQKSPPKAARSRGLLGRQEPVTWGVVKTWFEMHKIEKMDPAYVVAVKFAHAARVYVTGTTTGEVKIWDSKDCRPLGTLNHGAWNPRALLSNVTRVNQAKRAIEEDAYASTGKKK